MPKKKDNKNPPGKAVKNTRQTAGKGSSRKTSKAAAQPAPSLNEEEKSILTQIVTALKELIGMDDNSSKKIPRGRTLKTSDKNLPISKKGQSTNPKDIRRIAVIDSNSKDELAVVRLTTQKQKSTSPLPTYKKGNRKPTRYKHFVETKDNEGKPIKADGKKFTENPPSEDLTIAEVQTVRKKVLNHSQQASDNKQKISKMKARGKKGQKK